MTGRAGDLVDLELLDDDLDGWRENATAERDPGDWWKWLAFAAAAVALVGVVGSLWGGGETESVPDDAAEAPLTTVAPEESQAGGQVREGVYGDATPTLTPDGVPEGVVGPFDGVRPLPERIEVEGIPEGTALVGHNADAVMVAVGWDGTVTPLLGGDAFRYLPQTDNGASVMGTLSFTGEWISSDAAGNAVRIGVNDGDAPFFVAGGPGWVVHEKRTGQIRYFDRAGGAVGSGPVLVAGSELIAVATDGLVVRGLDGAASLVSFDDGAVLEEIPGDVLVAVGDRYVHVRCEGASRCEVAVRSLISDEVAVLPLDAASAGRSLVGLSDGGGYVVYRELGGVVVVIDAGTGLRLATVAGSGLTQASWFDDRHLVLWGSATSEMVLVSIASPDSLAGIALDVGGLIDPSLRGVRLLEVASAS